jgi:hypothetical protein
VKRNNFARAAAGAIVLLIALGAPLAAQNTPGQGEFIRGAVLDSEQYDNLPRRVELSSGAYQSLPPEISLKKYAPIPGDQTPYGTCVAWAAAYGARTISESVITERRQTRTITGNVYSPVFVYKSINNDPSCLTGTQIFSALDLMKNQGVPRMLDVERSSDFRKVSLAEFEDARKYTIADYVTLFRAERAGRGNTGPTHVQIVKKSLAERKPVIIGMNTPESFIHAFGLWRPQENPHHYYGGHAMVVVGYDDNRHGGAFEVLNSWGKKWGNAGYMWISYDTFGQWVREAYEIIENLAVWSDTNRFSGFARLEAEIPANGENTVNLIHLPGSFNREGYYNAATLPAGSRYRLILGKTDHAYLYAFTLKPNTVAANSTTPEGNATVTQIFPPVESKIIPVLDYAESRLTLPAENEWIASATQPGEEYLILLYAKQEINIRQLRARLGKARGPITTRVSQSIGAPFLPASACKDDELRFTAESNNNMSIFALIIKLDRAAQ